MSCQFRLIAALTVLVCAPFATTGAFAADGQVITVKANMARILRIDAPAATVIIGNPGVADVTIQDPRTLVLTGKSYGQTNLIVLDAAGNPIADTLIEVVQMQAGLVTIYQGDKRTSVSCAPVCQPVIMLGDEPAYTSNTMTSSSLVQSSANSP